MSYRFRMRIKLARIRLATAEHVLPLSDFPHSVSLTSLDRKTAIGDVSDLLLVGSGYSTADEANAAGAEWVAAVQVAFTELGIAADFGYRARGGTGMSNAAKKRIFAEHGIDVRTETNQLEVYSDDVETVFFGGSAVLSTGRAAAEIAPRAALAIRNRELYDSRQSLAYHLYSASFFESNPDSRFMILMMAVETLIEQPRQDAQILSHIDKLISATRSADLISDDIRSITSQLANLKRQSISQAGRKLARTLTRRYGNDEEPERFFVSCYGLRSKLAHGEYPRPAPDEVAERASHLEEFVQDLVRATVRTKE